MSPKLQAIEYLTEIQKYYIDNGGFTPIGYKYFKGFYSNGLAVSVSDVLKEKGYPPLNIDNFKNFVESTKNEFTIYEIPTYIYLLGQIKNDLRKFFSHMHKYGFFDPNKMCFPENVAVGTAQFGEINAMAIASPNSNENKVILLDSGLFIFINSFAKLVSIIFPKKAINKKFVEYTIQKPEIDQSLKENKEADSLFTNLIITYLTKGHSGFSNKFITEYHDNNLTEILRYTSELFILAHEYGHILLNHLSINQIKKRKLAEKLEVETWQIDWQQEFQADGFASIAVLRINHVINDIEAPIAFAGIPFFFFDN